MTRRVLFTLLIGAGVGVVSGMFGIGGGAFITLGLLALGFSQHQAHATSLAAIVLIAAAALLPYAAAGEVAAALALLLTATAMTGAYLGAGVMQRFSERRLRLVFVVFLVVSAVLMLSGVGPEAAGREPSEAVVAAGMVLVGLAAGALSSVLGIGGGLVMIPAMVLLAGFSQHSAEGTSLAVVIPTALVGAWRHHATGYTNWRSGLLVGAGGVIGGVVGAQIALSLDERLLRLLFGAFLAAMAVQLLRAGRSADRRLRDAVDRRA